MSSLKVINISEDTFLAAYQNTNQMDPTCTKSVPISHEHVHLGVQENEKSLLYHW